MTFRFTVPGQPVSWNASYRMGKRKVTDRHGQPVFGNDMQQKTISRQFKTAEARAYQDGVQMIAAAAKPNSFNPQHLIIVAYEFELSRMMDCDNIMKMLNDSIAKALGVNDSRFLPTVLTKIGASKHPQVTVRIFDNDLFKNDVISR
jgi:Holliday junction resolvase RusA-like endonuclease